MRPPLLSTPPVSHVISRKYQPTPAVTCRRDWRNLTSDTSIQIMSLETSEYHEDDTFYDVSNHISFVDTIISHREDDVSPGTSINSSPHIEEADVAETLVSIDSITRHHGNLLDARIIFTPKGARDCSTIGSHCQTNSNIPHKTDMRTSRYQHSLTRNCNSDSSLDIQRKLINEHTNRQALVTRSMSLNYAEYAKRNNDTCLLKPLLPCAYRSKISGVKRIPSFRDTVKPVTRAQTVINKMDTGIKTKTIELNDSVENKCSYQEGLERISKAGVPRSKIAKLVRTGLRSVRKSKGISSEKCEIQSDSVKSITTAERRRQRKIIHNTDIGGLSEFLRNNERRKTIAVITEEKYDSALRIETISSQANVDDIRSETPEKCTVKPVMGSRRLHFTGTSNLKFNQCQRKLVFQSARGSPKVNTDFDPSKYVEKYVCLENDQGSQPRRRPRLGVLGSTKCVNILPIDELEIDLVRDLKRRVERANRCSKIKTNGSLKVRSKVLPVDKPMISSPRRKSMLCRQSKVPTTRPSGSYLQLKRESVV